MFLGRTFSVSTTTDAFVLSSQLGFTPHGQAAALFLSFTLCLLAKPAVFGKSSQLSIFWIRLVFVSTGPGASQKVVLADGGTGNGLGFPSSCQQWWYCYRSLTLG